MNPERLVSAAEIVISNPAEPCPCGSSSAGNSCCLDSQGRIRGVPTALPPPKQFPVDFRHTGCYAGPLGGCSKQLTAEHYISHALLRRMVEGGGQLRVSKFHWLPDGETRTISPGSMAARVLCSNHNSVLEGYDSLGARFVGALMKTGEPGADSCRAVALFNGEDLERWFLKTLCGVTAMEASVAGEVWQAPLPWLNVLFKTAPPQESGFGIWLNLGGFMMFSDSTLSMSATPIDNPSGKDPLGLRLHFGGLEFVFLVGNQGRTRFAYDGRLRPGLLSFRTPGYCSLHLGMAYKYAPLGLHLRIEGVRDAHPPSSPGAER
jgi:hypothetical protein